jgi:hypothetical protein
MLKAIKIDISESNIAKLGSKEEKDARTEVGLLYSFLTPLSPPEAFDPCSSHHHILSLCALSFLLKITPNVVLICMKKPK